MPPTTRSQDVRKAIANSNTSPQTALSLEHQLEPRSSRQAIRDDKSSKSPSEEVIVPDGDKPPRFVINLSLPPEQRYTELCAVYRRQVSNLPLLFNEAVGGLAEVIPLKWIKRICRLCLRRVYDKEETRELQGISMATGVEMYLLVCFNVLLDLFMGCSSGGAATRDATGTKMLHFRTLDWGMPSLRKVIVQLDFVTETDGPTVASVVTYVGYVGVLTGVRKGLSISLNFRPNRNNKYEVWADTKYYWHLLLVLTGWRRSISSHIRQFLLPKRKGSSWAVTGFPDVIAKIGGNKKARPIKTTACYLCLSDGSQTTVFEKDLQTAVVRTSDKFIVITNNDVKHKEEKTKIAETETSTYVGVIAELVHEATDRRQCAEQNYQRRLAGKAGGLQLDDIVWLVQRFPTTNEATHYACVMDATEGSMPWTRQWKRPVTAKWIREHDE